jgi:D-3-phosphoglycerate dehydrogenase
MKVLIADKFETSGIDALRSADLEVISEPSLKDDALVEKIRSTECRVLVVRSTKVTEAMLTAGDALALVVRAGAGVNTIDLAAASRRSIAVANCPGKNAVAVAELAFALILALDRRIVHNTVDLQSGKWNKKEYSAAPGLKDRTLGLIGMGQIGQAVASRARAFEMNVVAWSRSLTPDQAEAWEITRCESPADVASQCDILSVHVAAAPETKNLISQDVIAQLRDGAYVINTARADVLDYRTLTAAVAERGLRVGLDVWPDEPSAAQADFSPEILDSGGVIYGTHHIGASTDQAQEAIARETVNIIVKFATSGRVLNCVNVRGAAASTWRLAIRHLNRPGVLAHVFSKLSHAGINVEEMENQVMEGSEAACAYIHLDVEPDSGVLEAILNENEHIVGVTLSGESVPRRRS